MTGPAVETIGSIRAGLGEGPVWDNERHLLLWIDIRLCRIYNTDIRTAVTTFRDLPGSPGSLALTREGEVLLAVNQELLVLSKNSEPRRLAALPTSALGQFNDGKPDAAGRFWVGTATADGHFDCCLWRYDPREGFSSQLPGISMSNGIGWSPDRCRMYYVDSVTHCLDVLEHDPESGTLGERRSLVTLPEGQLPDGLSVDAEGGIWLAVWGGACVLHLSPDGEELGRIHLPTPLVTSCAFGGPDYSTLFITTASEEDDDPYAGRLFSCKVGVKGTAPERVQVS